MILDPKRKSRRCMVWSHSKSLLINFLHAKIFLLLNHLLFLPNPMSRFHCFFTHLFLLSFFFVAFFKRMNDFTPWIFLVPPSLSLSLYIYIYDFIYATKCLFFFFYFFFEKMLLIKWYIYFQVFLLVS